MSAKRKSISSDLKRLDKMKDADIDYSDIPLLDETLCAIKIMAQMILNIIHISRFK